MLSRPVGCLLALETETLAPTLQGELGAALHSATRSRAIVVCRYKGPLLHQIRMVVRFKVAQLSGKVLPASDAQGRWPLCYNQLTGRATRPPIWVLWWCWLPGDVRRPEDAVIHRQQSA
jgi:hypothetical protein